MAFRFEKSGFLTKGVLVGVSAAALMLAGCGKKSADHPVGQVIAHVGQEEITLQELENEFRLANVPVDKRDDAVTKKAMLEIVTRKAVARQAVAAKIDREPTIQLDLLRDKEQMLARSLMQRKLSGEVAGIGQSDIDQFITAHPTQFAKRVVFVTDQIEIPPQALTAELGAATKDAKSLAQVDQALTGLKIAFRRSTGALDSASLPPQVLQQLQSNHGDDVFFVRTGNGGVFFKITETQSKPLTGADANNLARQLIAKEKAEALAQQVSTDAQNSATYEGDYVRIMKDAPKTAPAKDVAPQNAPAKDAAPQK
jgi:EpsD family peptidyl-prolyl cis-trans isomerase